MTVENNSKKRNGDIFLLTGTLRSVHLRTQQHITLQVLLDTGADRSFIDAKVADELGLPSLGTTTMNVKTFGAERPAKTQSTTTYLQAWDADGVQHQLRLYTQDNLTKNFSEAKLDEEDIQFIRRNHIQTST
ncbi:hypothetical protein RB195_025338 [Necator americanus]|uniref:Peptidase A2 domain-containing protein n=1 Tax=Necator americanus TaxID=51031 RepID=A0ABR1ERV2_NECAM